MRNLQDYIDKYKGIADGLGYTGESVDLLIQLLANASYIGEVENVVYMQEASIEKSNHINSKIQHCMDTMYSVYRGLCPRVIMKFSPNRYMSFSPYDEMLVGSDFTIHYLGYYQDGEGNKRNADSTGIDGKFVYSPIRMSPSLEGETYIVIGILSKKTSTVTKTLDSNNTYYIDCPENNLSNDVYVKINGNPVEVTRIFSDHVLNPKKYVFDLTLPSYGSRLYLANFFSTNPLVRSDSVGITINTYVEATYFNYCSLETDFQEQSLYRFVVEGAEYVPFNEDFLSRNKWTETHVGRIYVPEVGRNELNTIHYKANRDRFVNSIMRSNSDIGTVLEETFPDVVKQGGTASIFRAVDSTAREYQLLLYYIPADETKFLTTEQINNFRNEKTAYYVVSEMVIQPGTRYNVRLSLDIEVYQNEDISEEIENIVYTYENKFGVEFNDETLSEISTLISKISNVKRIVNINLSYYDENNLTIDIAKIDPATSYYKLSPVVTLISEQ